MARVYKMSTEVGSYEKNGEIKKNYADLGRIVIADNGNVFGEIFDAFNNKTIKFNAFEIQKK